MNPDILTWARETAGLSPAEAAHAVGLKGARGRTGEERLLAMEQGEEEPSRALLVRMSEKYRRPLLTFYLREPPLKGSRGQDFRVAPNAPPPEYSPTLDALIRDINARQSVVKSLLEDEEAQPLPFIGSANMEQGASAVADSIAETIAFDLQEFRKQESVESAFQYLREKIEAVRIFVVLAGNLGSHHTNISPEIFRGFAIADPIAPFVIINDQDAKTAWSFTALHEVAHLWLGTTGISGSSWESRIERFCNDVAGALLLPSDELRALADIGQAPFDDAIEVISAFAGERNVSRALIAYNLLRANLIAEPLWYQFKNRFYEDWIEGRAARRESQRASSGGPNYYVVRRHRLGPALLNLVNRSLSEGLITPTKAGRVLGVKPRNVAPLLRDVGGGL